MLDIHLVVGDDPDCLSRVYGDICHGETLSRNTFTPCYLKVTKVLPLVIFTFYIFEGGFLSREGTGLSDLGAGAPLLGGQAVGQSHTTAA